MNKANNILTTSTLPKPNIRANSFQVEQKVTGSPNRLDYLVYRPDESKVSRSTIPSQYNEMRSNYDTGDEMKTFRINRGSNYNGHVVSKYNSPEENKPCNESTNNQYKGHVASTYNSQTSNYNTQMLSMYSPPMSRTTSPNVGLSPLENLSIAQLSALAPV